MFKKSADLIHLHERTGSHATKGGARGTPWFDQLTDDEKELIEIRRACDLATEQFRKVRNARKRAKEAGDKELTKQYSEMMRRLLKNVKKAARERGIDGIKIRWY